ncbi:putative ABC transport system permease protein [Caldalkalibacillus uzonensis]|uniref:ABC transport system permease protein n=1 Tax=Caldalkalibacillus uzonensis TaxID=353224 RepID=A0ABU0CYA2_9BACI|nr:ABC transporter permease [Caldalkalibacillus uzonensis]MDQ0341128.1 putative ABC transport system permease protein [Caldalkalibacillus uzonensis]
MSILDSIKMAITSIMAHKLRSALTMLGIIIGVGAVITVVAIGQAGEAALKSTFAGSGNNTLDIYYEPPADQMFYYDPWSETYFTDQDVEDLARIPEIERVIAYNSQFVQLHQREENTDALLIGMTDGYYDVEPLDLTMGRLIQPDDILQARRVMLISEDVRRELFAEENPIGQTLELERQVYQIIGVFEEERTDFFNFGTNKVIVPLSTWPMIYGYNEIQNLTIQAKDARTLEIAGEKATQLLNNKKDVEGQFVVFNLEQIQEQLSVITGIMTAIIGGIAGISLVVGGIGVMNIMLVSVTERTREIGIRKALGATRGKILFQFLIEAMALTTIGGSIGILLGTGGAYLITMLLKLPPLVSVPVMIGGLVFSMVIGIIFGILPANKAAKLDPIEALRYE